MAAMRAEELLARKATEVANSCSPHDWGSFIEALEVYAKQLQAEVVTAEPGLILRAQGRAQAAATVLKTIADCRNITAVANTRRASQ